MLILCLAPVRAGYRGLNWIHVELGYLEDLTGVQGLPQCLLNVLLILLKPLLFKFLDLFREYIVGILIFVALSQNWRSLSLLDLAYGPVRSGGFLQEQSFSFRVKNGLLRAFKSEDIRI